MVEKRFGRKAGLSCLALFLMASLLLVPATPVLAQNTPPVAVADVAPRTGAVPLTIHCVNPDSYDPEGGGLSWEWNFGDGSPVIGSTSATHVYTTTGIFNVTLTVTDESGLQDSDTVTINVLSTEPPPTPSPPGGQVTLQDIVVPFPGGYVPLSWGWELTPNTDYCIFYGYDAVWDTHYLVDAIQCQAYTNIRLGLDFGFRYEGQVYWPEEFDHGMFFWENEDLPLPLEVLARPDSKTEPEWMIVVTAYDGNTLTFTLDWDGDGITDNVDTERSTPSADFSDGNTSGSIISLDEGTSVLITDALDTNDGVMVVVSGPEDGDARIRIDGDAAGVLQLPPGEYIFTTYVDNHGKPALRKVIKKKLVARPVIFKRSDSKAEIKLHNVGIYSSEKRSVILEVSEGGLAEVEYNIGDTMTVVVIASGGSVELDETLTPGGTLSEVVVTARAEGVTVNGIPLTPDTSVSPIVPIDIKPGSDPNSINLGSGGSVPVAILSTPAFDATTVDPTTVTLASAPVRLKGKGTPMATPEDVNGDGLLDLVIHISTEAFVISEADQQAVLEGKIFDGVPIMGTDSVRVVPHS